MIEPAKTQAVKPEKTLPKNRSRGVLLSLVCTGGVLCYLPAYGQLPKTPDSCIQCHTELGGELAAPVEGLKNDVHAAQGLSCADCHGGDPKAGFEGDMEAAMNPRKGYVGVPSREKIPEFCARCHSSIDYMRKYNPRLPTDQLTQYKTSMHGKLLAKGDTKVAVCTDCHGVHGIRPANDPRSTVYAMNVPTMCGKCHSNPQYMQGYSIPTDQLEKYKASVHGQMLLAKSDLSAPACNDCHGNHGAFPPGLTSIAYICGQCHLNNAELFLKSPHKPAFDELSLPECEVCHGNHAVMMPTDEMLGSGPQSVCMQCHEPESKGYQVAVAMKEQIVQLKREISLADSLLSKAERSGIEVSAARFDLHDADDSLIKARTVIHSFNLGRVQEVTQQGLAIAKRTIEAGWKALAEIQFRRKWLAISMLIIFVVAATLYAKIREIDKRTKTQGGV